MISIPIMLAEELEVQDVVASWRANSSALSSYIVVGAIALVTLLVLIWAMFFRNTKRRHRSHHHSHEHSSAPAESPATGSNGEDASLSRHKRRRWRRSQRHNHSRNPTLAETGGLPPIRQDEPPAPPA